LWRFHRAAHLFAVPQDGESVRTPPGFIFAAKLPGEITHKKLLTDRERETEEFPGVIELLDQR
jgi:uncharacterized protein YecE (DUF72 family)